MRTAFRAGKTLRSLLTRVKDALPVEKQSVVVYQTSCSCGKVYTGKTIRRLETRIKEHKDACNQQQIEKSAVAEHAWEEDHPNEWSGTSIMEHARGYKELLMKEALLIQTAKSNRIFNKDGGVWVHDCWINAIKGHGRQGQFPRQMIT